VRKIAQPVQMMTGSLVTNKLHLCNLIPSFYDIRGTELMEHMSTGTWATDPELDEALARAIRQLIAEAIEVGGAAGADSASTAA
jgi:hypothetical protein